MAKIVITDMTGCRVRESVAIKFKFYADSTIRRGNKDYRRNCFLYDLGDGILSHIVGLDSRGSRNSLKWIVEKKEEFMALECGANYCWRILVPENSQFKAEIVIDFNQTDISFWQDKINPDK